MGKFHGVMRPMTPSGSRVISTSIPGRTEASFSPAMRRASPEKNRKICPARMVSPMPSARVLPSSRASSRPISSLRARISSPMRFRDIVAQLDGGTRPGGKGSLRRRDRALHIAGGRLRKFADDVIGIGGIDVRLLPGRFAPGAGDEVLGLDHGWHLLLLIDLWSSARRRNRSWSFLPWRGRGRRSTGPSTPLPSRNPRTPSSPLLQRRSHRPDAPER